MSTRFKHVVTSLAIALLRAIRWFKRALEGGLGILAVVVLPFGSSLIHWVILPVYRIVLMTKIKLGRMALPARGLILFFASNRYLFHAVLCVAVLATIITNLQTRQVHAQDVGQHSLLYALATDANVEIVSETAELQRQARSLSYLDKATLIAIPHIDFDYDETQNDVASFSVPGSISAPPLLIGGEQEVPQAPRTKIETYVVKDGDTIGSIARDFGVNVGTILWSNNMTERQYIRPGDALKIPPVSGVLVVVKKGDTIGSLALRYQGDEDEIREMNHLNDTSLALGTEIVIPGGQPIALQQRVIAVVGRNQQVDRERASQSNDEQESVVPHAPVLSNVPKPPDVDTHNLPAAKLLWPTSGHMITQYYGWKHTGVDIDGDFSSPLLAAYDGVVEKAGWNNGGYGLQIMIKHPNGMETRYAHASKLFVKVGDPVKRGQVIAMMGSTGRSTGSHLHFEVYINGKRANPLAYIR